MKKIKDVSGEVVFKRLSDIKRWKTKNNGVIIYFDDGTERVLEVKYGGDILPTLLEKYVPDKKIDE